MPESRDRLVREAPMSPIFTRRFVGGIRFDAEQEMGGGRNLFGTPLMVRRRGSLMDYRGSPLMGRTGGGSPWGLSGQENRSLVGNGRRGGGARGRLRNATRGSVLPAWYPRRPLQDVTSVVDAIERRRSRLREVDDHHGLATPLPRQLDSPILQQEPSTSARRAPLEHSFILDTPKPTELIKTLRLPNHVMPKTLLGNQAGGEIDFMTPQKKLLNSIDQVEKVMREEFKRMKRTPIAKRAERECKVRTLMAMR